MITYPLTPPSGTQTRVVECGDRSGPVVVFVHGLAARAERWTRNLEVVAASGFRCVAFDLPGHGFADRGAEAPATIPAIIDAIDQVVDAVVDDASSGPVTLVGSSIGGLFCAHLAARDPRRFSGLHLAAPMGLEALGEQGRGGLAQRLLDQRLPTVRRKVEALGLDTTDEEERWSHEEYLANGSPAGLAYLTRLAHHLESDADRYLIRESLEGLIGDLEVVLYWGELDRVLDPGIGRRASETFGLPLVTFPRSGHAPYLSEAGRFNSALLGHLAAQGAPAR